MNHLSKNTFQLIKSLTRSEKGYFKKLARTHSLDGGNNYIKLFDAIDKQGEYDEDDIKSSFKGEPFIKQLHRVKNYLNNQIMKSLRLFHSETSVDGRLKDTVKNLEILYTKGLFRQCRKALATAKQTAYKYDKLLRVLELIQWERKLIPKEAYTEKYAMQLMDVFYEREEILAKQRNLYEFQVFYDRMFSMLNESYQLRTSSDLKTFEEIINARVFSNERHAMTFTSKIFFHYCHAAFHYVRGELKESYPYVVKCLEIVESRPDMIMDSPDHYINALSNWLTLHVSISSIQSAETDEQQYFNVLERLRKIPTRSTEISTRIFIKSYLHEMEYYINTGDYERGKIVIPKVLNGLKEYRGKLNRVTELVLYYDISHLYFIGGDYSNALKWLNEVLNDMSVELRQDIIGFSRIRFQIIHYELGNFDLLKYASRSAQRMLYNKNRLYNYEKAILEFIKKVTSARSLNRKKLKKMYSELKEKLELGSKIHLESNFDERYHLMCWVESKLQNKPLSMIIKGIS